MSLMFIRKIRISRRLKILFQLMIIPLVMLFVIFLVVTNKLHDIENSIMVENVSNIRAVYNLELSLLRLRRLNANYIIRPEKKYLDDFNREAVEFRKWNRIIGAKTTDPADKATLKNISGFFDKYISRHDDIVKFIREKKTTRAIDMMLSEGNTYYDAISYDCEKIISVNDETIQESEQNALKYLFYSKVFSYATIFVFICIGFIASVIVSKSITDPINEIEKESAGFPASAKQGDELEILKTRFRGMIKTVEDSRDRLIKTERRAAVGQIAAGISHELNNPVGIISGFAEMLSKSEGMSNKDRTIANEILRESHRCRALLGDLLNFAKTPNPQPRRTNIISLVQRTVRTYQNNDRFRNVVFNIVHDRKSAVMSVDSLQLRQVFMNIINNACDAMRYRGTITIKLSAVSDGMILAFNDTGPGIKEEDRNQIFSPFFSTKKNGTGLGLAISHDIIDRHMGELKYVPSKKGARFEIKLGKGAYVRKGNLREHTRRR